MKVLAASTPSDVFSQVTTSRIYQASRSTAVFVLSKGLSAYVHYLLSMNVLLSSLRTTE